MLNISCTACLHTLHNHLMSFFHCYRVGMFSYRSFVILKRSLLAYFTLMIFLLSNSILFYLTISDIVFYFTISDIELRLSSGPCFSYFSYFSLLFFYLLLLFPTFHENALPFHSTMSFMRKNPENFPRTLGFIRLTCTFIQGVCRLTRQIFNV